MNQQCGQCLKYWNTTIWDACPYCPQVGLVLRFHNQIRDLEQTIRDLKKQLREAEKERDHYKAIVETLKDAPKPEYG